MGRGGDRGLSRLHCMVELYHWLWGLLSAECLVLRRLHHAAPISAAAAYLGGSDE